MNLAELLARTTWATDRWTAYGHLFIRKNPDDAVNCHEIYRGCDLSEIAAIRNSFDGMLSNAQQAILEIQNGARLFDNGITIYGSRAPVRKAGSLADAGPIRCEDEARYFPILYSDLWDLGFRPFGGISTNTVQNLVVSKDGQLWIRTGESVRGLGEIEAFLAPLVKFWDECC